MKKQFSILAGIIILAASCAKNDFSPKSNPSAGMPSKTMSMLVSRDSNLVDSSMAAYVASYYNNGVFLKQAKSTTKRAFASSYTLPDKNGDPALYIFNYANNAGYVVISADFRYQPILSISESGNINQKATIPSMLGIWFGQMVENVELLRDNRFNNTSIGYHEWSNLMGGGYIPNNNSYLVPNDPGSGPYSGGGSGCTTVDYTKGPLLQTSWSQGCGYNDYTPVCSSDDCGHMPTGCVATTMAQIIKYWHPTNGYNYNYTYMSNDFGASETARLMHDAGLKVNMDYSCSGSGASSSDVASALIHNFGFTAGTYSSTYNAASDFFQTIEGDLDYNKPVALSGCTGEVSIFGWQWGASDCHEWVCDGYRTQGTTCGIQTWAHMNWGWSGSGNGWSYINDWNPQGYAYHFNYVADFTYNMHP